jgi:O-antigen/teichoic acid export membrane protein
MMTFSLPILPASLIGYMSTNYLDAFFIAHYLSGADLGVYAVAYLLSGSALQFPLLAGLLLMPLFVTLGVSGRDQRITSFVSSTLPSLTLLWVTTCAAIAFVGGYLVPIVFGDSFSGAAGLLWPLMAAAAIAGPVQMAYNPIAHARSATYITMVASIAAALTNVTLNFLLIPRFGLIGCAWATTAAYAIHVIIQICWIQTRLLSTRSWTLQALLPIVFGAAFASKYGNGLIAFLVTLMTTALLAVFHRTAIVKSFATLNQYRSRTLVSRAVSLKVNE